MPPLSVLNVSATDLDQGLGGEVVVTAGVGGTGLGNATGVFSFNNITGEILLEGLLDARNASEYHMTFVATDRAFPYVHLLFIFCLRHSQNPHSTQ